MNLTDLNQIRPLLERHGFRFSRSLGQNFLTAAWVPERIAESAGLEENTGVLEVGPGIGCLTAELSRRAGKVLAVELDRALKPILAETLAGADNVELLFADVLKLDLAQLVRERLPGLRPVVCANLPYNVTSPLLTAFLTAGCFESVTVMVQKEVAQRLCARAGSAEYGAFSLLVQWHTEPELLFTVPPDCFVPRPKVHSAVVRLRRRESLPAPVEDEALLFRVIRAAFNQRRKTLVNALCAGIGEVTKEEAEYVVKKAGFDPKIRGEALEIGGFAKIADEIGKILKPDL